MSLIEYTNEEILEERDEDEDEDKIGILENIA